jgi:hypothetical protein
MLICQFNNTTFARFILKFHVWLKIRVKYPHDALTQRFWPYVYIQWVSSYADLCHTESKLIAKVLVFLTRTVNVQTHKLSQ